jgi:threonine/homoserine/homoserine lactone efflux protein
MAATATGLTGLILAQPGVGPVVSVLAAAYILYLAYRVATAPPMANATNARAPGLGPGLFLGLGNPKAYAAMAALYSGFPVLTNDPVADAVLKTGILLPIIVVVDVLWLLVGSALTRAARRPPLNRAINVAFAAVLVASVGLAFVL